MKTTNEIIQKIDQYIEKITNMPEGTEKENYCSIIDALLWVIDDSSGKPI